MYVDLVKYAETKRYNDFCEKVNENLKKLEWLLKYKEREEITQKVAKNFELINLNNEIFQIDLLLFYEEEPEKFKNNFKLYKNFWKDLDYTRRNKYYYQNFLNKFLKFLNERKAQNYA